MKVFKKIGVMTAAAAMLLTLIPPSTAMAGESGDLSLTSCPELGHHTSVESVTPKFMAGAIPKTWLAPGASYTYKSGSSVAVTGSINASVGTDFWKVAHAKVDASLQKSNSITIDQSWSWKNNSKSTKWVQLGIRGYSFDYVSYDVVSPCNVVNKKYVAHAILPTKQAWLNHS